MSFDLAAYLQRIGIAPVEPDIAGLRALQQAQMRAVTFENFDPLLGRIPALGMGDLFDKIVRCGRGGYCFELNGLFGAALTELGFASRRVLARVRLRGGPDAPRSHLVHLVEVEGRQFLADAGFGGPGSLVPIELGAAGPQAAPNATFRFTEDAELGETVLERLGEDGWIQLYAFDGARVSDSELATANYVCATWDVAPFAAHAMLGRYRGDVRYGLFDRALTVETPQGEERRFLTDFQEFAAVVQGEFGLPLSLEELEQAWEKLPA